ncbi:MAG: RNase adapter RapZ [Bifidobacteriaceae bacterium]|jgi:UPF0042 nucleotide-binding protein|nr:RNase adapter RapZ [Bifidobacteriaceae bacterium]
MLGRVTSSDGDGAVPTDPTPTFPAGVPQLDAAALDLSLLAGGPFPGEILVITGMSGAGRTMAAGVLQDHGWYVVDNIPPRLIAPLAGMMTPSGPGVTRLAVVVDVRSRQFFRTLVDSLDALEAAGIAHRVLFLDAGDDTLVRRYEQVRRPHPLQGDHGLLAGIAREREVVEPLRRRADQVIDTSSLTVHDLAREMGRFADPGRPDELVVAIQSFGFKYGVPVDANHVLDVRFLDNPYWIDELRHLTGLDEPVRRYVLGLPGAGAVIEHYTATLAIALDACARDGHPRVAIAVGCTGGKHRSVAMAEELAAHLAHLGRVRTTHRDLGRE